MSDHESSDITEPVDRTALGGTPRSTREQRQRDNRPPASPEELSRGAGAFTDNAGHTDHKVNWVVLTVSAAVILAFSLWAIIAPDNADSVMASVVDAIASGFGWYYVLTVAIVIGFVLWVALSRTGRVRLGPDHSRPSYSLFTWVSMLFAAGVGIDMLFYSVTGPVTQYMTPANADPESAEATRDAVVWTMFHYGISGWAMYSLLGAAMGYFAFRWGMPLSIRAALYPLLGRRVKGKTGYTIDIVTLVGTVMGVATSMGIGVVLLSVGFSKLFGLPDGLGLQIALVGVAVIITVAACTSGVDKGIRIISEMNLWVAGAMILYIIVTGKTSFLLNTMVANVGRFINALPERTMETMGYEPDGADWMGGWTLFFWAFWLAWGPFPGATFIIGLATLSGLLFYLTSANSGAMVMSTFSASIPDPAQDGPKWLRIFWALVTAVLTVAMLIAGGVSTMEHATLIFALPVTVIAYLVMMSFSKALRMERVQMDGVVQVQRGSSRERTWRQRLAGLRHYPDADEIRSFTADTVAPALDEVHTEFTRLGYDAMLTCGEDAATSLPTWTLLVPLEHHRGFQYMVAPVTTPVPSFGGRRAQSQEDYLRLEVFDQTGTRGYDLNGLTTQQIVDDVIDRYEMHLSFLTESASTDTRSRLTPPVTPVAEPSLIKDEE